MNDKTNEAFCRLGAWADPREVLAWSESLRLGRSRALYVGDDGVLLYIPNSKNYMVAAECEQGALRLFSCIPEGERRSRVLLFADADHAEACGIDSAKIFRYRNCVYDRLAPVDLSGRIDIRQLTPEDLDSVSSHYDMIPVPRILHHLQSGWLYGGFDTNGSLVGFIGEHDEGSMGMLEVFEQYRRKGYARELQGAAINRMLAAGRTPFGQVVLGNEASFALQRSLGMSILGGVQCWTEPQR